MVREFVGNTLVVLWAFSIFAAPGIGAGLDELTGSKHHPFALVGFVIPWAVVSVLTLGGAAAVNAIAYGLVPFGLTIAAIRTVQRQRHRRSNLVRGRDHRKKHRRLG
jgi:hypothetical protein